MEPSQARGRWYGAARSPRSRAYALQIWVGVTRIFRITLLGLGLFALLMMVLACTRVPFQLHRWLGTVEGECFTEVDHIVVLGGSGMPSGPELLRLHRAASLAAEFPEASVLVVHPQGAHVVQAMVQELVLRGVPFHRIRVLPGGDNTREQALLYQAINAPEHGTTALVTAPENMARSVRSFRKAGTLHVCGAPAWDHAMPHEFRYDHSTIGGKGYLPDVSGAPGMRYTFWNYLKLEVTCMREFVALAYYRLNGWV